MTKTDIIQAAFQVWGADFYLKTSLTEIAHALNVTKPALYRHFSNKEELLNAMYENFFDVLAGFLSPFFDKSYKEDANEGLITIALGFAEFFLRNNEYFVFFLIYILENGDKEHNVFSKIALRGLNIEKLMAADNGGNRPSKLMFVMRNIGFMTARYNKKFFKVKKKPEETEINEFIQTAAFYIRRGLGFNKQIIDALDWDHIEQSVLSIPPPPPNNGYSGDSPAIRAAASVIAELGPWDVTMEKVADKLGLSKSSLYSHFQNKNDMIIKVFLNEFEKMTLFAAAAAYQSNKNEELLYSAFFSIAQYFRQNPDILNALSHLKTRRPYKEAGMEEYESLHDCEKHKSKHFDFSVIFRHIKDDKQNPIISETAAEWMFFILIHTFMHYHDTIMFKDIPNEYFRIVYRYIALGIE